MEERHIKEFVVTLYATFHFEPELLPLDETCHFQVTNLYGWTKLFIEEILCDCYAANNSWNILILWYFNLITEDLSFLIRYLQDHTTMGLYRSILLCKFYVRDDFAHLLFVHSIFSIFFSQF
jgi:UDP-glucose 4-epimerase